MASLLVRVAILDDDVNVCDCCGEKGVRNTGLYGDVLGRTGIFSVERGGRSLVEIQFQQQVFFVYLES